MDTTDFVQRTVFFLEEYALPDGRSKYKKLIEDAIKSGESESEQGVKLPISKKDLAKYDKELVDVLPQMEDKFKITISIYKTLRTLLLQKKVPGMLLGKEDTVFITQEYIDKLEGEEKPTFEEFAKQVGGYVDEINGQKVIVTKFWKLAMVSALVHIAELEEKKKQ